MQKNYFHVTSYSRIHSIMEDGFLIPPDGKKVISQWADPNYKSFYPRKRRVYLSNNPVAIANYGNKEGLHYLVVVKREDIDFSKIEIDEDEICDLLQLSYSCKNKPEQFDDQWQKESAKYQELISMMDDSIFRPVNDRYYMNFFDMLPYVKRNYTKIVNSIKLNKKRYDLMKKVSYRFSHKGKVKIHSVYEIEWPGADSFPNNPDQFLDSMDLKKVSLETIDMK